MSDHQKFDEILDAGVEQLRNLELDPSEAEEAAARVRRRLAREIPGFSATATSTLPKDPGKTVLRGCDDFQALIPAYLAGNLSSSRRLLLEDHSRSCLPCRRALGEARSGKPAPNEPQPLISAPARALPLMRWAAAAVLAVGLGLTAWTLLDVLSFRASPSATIAALEGELYQVHSQGYAPLAVGQELPFRKKVRTAKDSGAVLRLADGTEVEMSPRAELELVQRRKGTTIELGRGNVIVEAAPQGSGRLFVSTDDCLVSVKGTIFSVNSGTKGSRVSVMEGQVAVDYGTREALLEPGQQVSTHPSLGPVPVARDIAWSRNYDEYIALMRELGALGEELDRTFATPQLRYGTELLDLMPAETTFYATVPNLSSNLEEAYDLIQERIGESPALEAWWQESVASGADEEALEQGIREIARLGSFLGEELVISLSSKTAGSSGAEDVSATLLIVAQTKDASGLRDYAGRYLASRDPKEFPLRLVEDLAADPAPEGSEALLLWIGDDLAALALRLESLRSLAATAREPESNPFLSRPFRQRLAEAYGDGVDALIGADMARLVAASDKLPREVLERAGVLDVDTLILERKTGAAVPVHYRAALSFNGPRRGIASWLGSPAPMRSLDFVSPDANFVSAALSKEPRQIVEELLGLLELTAPELRQRIDGLENELGLRWVDDVAAPLGGEVTFALDGPILPTPSWKLIAEIYDRAQFQDTLRRVVSLINEHSEQPEGYVSLEETQHQGLDVYALKSTLASLSIYYTFVDGYILAGPSTALLERAVQFRDSGYTLVDSPRFTALLPSDGQVNFSALTFQNLGPALGPLAELWAQKGKADPGAEGAEGAIAPSSATLTSFYGEEDRIIAVSNSERGEFASLVGVSAGLGIDRWVKSFGSGKFKVDVSHETQDQEAE